MRRTISWVMIVALLVLVAAPVVAAQGTPSEVVQAYYAALGQAAAGGDTAALLDLFADDATVSVPGLTPQPVQGKEAIQATLGGMLAMLQGLTVTVGNIAESGEQVTVNYTMSTAGSTSPIPVTDTFVIKDGKIQSLTIAIAPEALASMASATPTALPATGGAVSGLLPALLVLGGMALIGLGRKVCA